MEEQPGDKHGGCFSYLEEKNKEAVVLSYNIYKYKNHELLEEVFLDHQCSMEE